MTGFRWCSVAVLAAAVALVPAGVAQAAPPVQGWHYHGFYQEPGECEAAGQPYDERVGGDHYCVRQVHDGRPGYELYVYHPIPVLES